MAKSRVSRQGVKQFQVTVWVNEPKYKIAERKLAEAKAKSGVSNISLSALCGGILEGALK